MSPQNLESFYDVLLFLDLQSPSPHPLPLEKSINEKMLNNCSKEAIKSHKQH